MLTGHFSDFILTLLNKDKVFSEPGTSEFTREQSTYLFFRNLLDEVEGMFFLILYNVIKFLLCLLIGEQLDIGMDDILSFFTGAENIPPLGFEAATLNFSPNNPYPTASTCGLSLTLPTKYYNYSDFKENFAFAIQNHGGFGLY